MDRARLPLRLVACGSLVFVVGVLAITWHRLVFPYDVEWMEGGVLMQAERLARGASAYPPPSATYVPFLYPPLYSWVVAALGNVTGGISYALARGVSAFASVLTAALACRVVLRHTARWEFALLTLGLSAALYSFAGSFHDLVRPDALAMALCMTAAVLAERGSTWRLALAGALIAAACFAKQTSFVIGLGVLIAVHLTRDRRALAVVASAALVTGLLAFAWWESATGGLFSFYVVKGHQAHRFYRDNFGFFFYRDALHLAPLLLVVPLVWLWRAKLSPALPWLLLAHLGATVVQRFVATSDLPHMYFRDLWYPHRAWGVVPVALLLVMGLAARGAGASGEAALSPASRYWGSLFVAAMLASATGHATQWAFKNSLLPLATLGVPFVLVAAHELVAAGAPRVSAQVALAFAIQFAMLAENPAHLTPSAGDRAAWDALKARLAKVAGATMVLGHPRLSFELGQGEHLHGMGIADLASMGGVPDLEGRLARHEWAAIVIDVDDGMGVPPVVARYYRRSESLGGPPMKTGTLCRAGELWIPR